MPVTPRLTALFGVVLVVSACPPKKQLPDPPPSGRCEVNLDEAGLFANIGTGAQAKVVATDSELIGGPWAQGRTGDVLLQNDRIRVVIQQPTRLISPTPYGGTIIDADLRRPAGEPGRDTFGKLEVLYAFGRTINAKKVEVLRDGSAGGFAVVAATGDDAVLDYINVPNVIERFLGSGVKLVSDPNEPLPLTATTYYVLSPGETRVRALTAFCNSGTSNIVMQVGDILEQGGEGEPFNPASCSKGFGVKGCLVDPGPWIGDQANGVAYAVRTYNHSNPKVPATNALLYVAGVAGILAGGENQSGLLSWVDPMATKRPGAFGVLAGASRTYLRDFFVGRDLAAISSTLLDLDGSPRSRLNLTVKRPDGAPVAAARVAISEATSSQKVTVAITDSSGATHLLLPPGSYLLSTGEFGAAVANPMPVTVPATGEVTANLVTGELRTLTVNVKDPFGQGLTARVVVACVAGPCATPVAAWRPFFDVEEMPSTIQAIAFASAQGVATVKVPPGQYEVLVTRGPEYSAFPDTFPDRGHSVDLATQDATVNATIAHVVDTTGWMSADLHVHAVNSADSSVPNAQRVMSFAAEGVDILVSTDHDYITDYGPLVHQLGVQDQMASMIGCEVTPFDYGHQQAYPVVASPGLLGGAFDWAGGDGPSLRLDQLYAGLRAASPNVVLQMNHPRGAPGGSLTMVKIDTATGATHAPPETFRLAPHPEATATDTKLFSPNFDAFEVMNGTTANLAVMNDWMTFLSRGWVKTGTGVSDTHNTTAVTGGYGRTWIKMGVDTPAQFDPAALAVAMKAHHAVASSGPFVIMTARKVDSTGTAVGAPVGIGDTLSLNAAGGETVELTVDVQAPEWMQFDAVEIYTHTTGREATNGEANTTWPTSRIHKQATLNPAALPLEAVPGLNGFAARRVHVVQTFTVTPTGDTWYVAMVRAGSTSRSLFPMAWDDVSCSGGICTASSSRPEAFTNPILIDGDNSGAYDTFPLQPGHPLSRPPATPAPSPRRTPSLDEVNSMLRKLLSHDHKGT